MAKDLEAELNEMKRLIHEVADAKSVVSAGYMRIANAIDTSTNPGIAKATRDLGDELRTWSDRWQDLYTYILSRYQDETT